MISEEISPEGKVVWVMSEYVLAVRPCSGESHTAENLERYVEESMLRAGFVSAQDGFCMMSDNAANIKV
jgi:hypothetical protein